MYNNTSPSPVRPKTPKSKTTKKKKTAKKKEGVAEPKMMKMTEIGNLGRN